MIGGAEGVTSLLLQSQGGRLRLFPAWPRARPASFSTLRAVGAFLVSARVANGVVADVVIESERGGACTIENPWWPEHAFCVVDGSGASVPTRQSDADPSTVTFPTTAAVWYACRAC